MIDPDDEVLAPDVAADAAKLAGIFRFLAEVEFPGYSPLYEHLATRIADELWIPALISQHNRSSFAAVLFLDCVRELTLDDPSLPLARRYDEIVDGADPLDPDPWPMFRELVAARRDELAALLEDRTIQTNEVGRSAALMPAFTAVAERFDRPLALIEIGCSAGLNLFFDRFHIDYGAGGAVGPADSPVRLTCAIRGELWPPVPTTAPRWSPGSASTSAPSTSPTRSPPVGSRPACGPTSRTGTLATNSVTRAFFQDAAGKQYYFEPYALMLQASHPLDGEIAPGKKISGTIGYQLPTQAGDLIWIVADNAGNRAAFAVKASDIVAEGVPIGEATACGDASERGRHHRCAHRHGQ